MDCDESTISFDVKRLYSNTQLNETIEIAMRILYEQTSTPDLCRKTMKKLLVLAVMKNHFDGNVFWYVQKDGPAMSLYLEGIHSIL